MNWRVHHFKAMRITLKPFECSKGVMVKITIGTAAWSNQNVHSIWKLKWVSHAPHAAISRPFGFIFGQFMNWRVHHFMAMCITLKPFECSKGVMIKITIGTAAWSNQNVHSIWKLKWVRHVPHTAISRPYGFRVGHAHHELTLAPFQGNAHNFETFWMFQRCDDQDYYWHSCVKHSECPKR